MLWVCGGCEGSGGVWVGGCGGVGFLLVLGGLVCGEGVGVGVGTGVWVVWGWLGCWFGGEVFCLSEGGSVELWV